MGVSSFFHKSLKHGKDDLFSTISSHRVHNVTGKSLIRLTELKQNQRRTRFELQRPGNGSSGSSKKMKEKRGAGGECSSCFH